jgi:hypothetical protein
MGSNQKGLKYTKWAAEVGMGIPSIGFQSETRRLPTFRKAMHEIIKPQSEDPGKSHETLALVPDGVIADLRSGADTRCLLSALLPIGVKDTQGSQSEKTHYML